MELSLRDIEGVKKIIYEGLDERIIEIVTKKLDEREKIITIGRSDLNELKYAVKDLEVEQKGMKVDINDLKVIVKELAEAQKELTKAQKETQIELTQLAKQVGSLTDTIGYSLEDIAHLVLPSYLEKNYGLKIEKFEKAFIKYNKSRVEIDFYSEGQNKEKEAIIVIGEVKRRIGKDLVKEFIDKYKKIEKVLSSKTQKIFLFMFGYWMSYEAQQKAKAHKIEMIATYQTIKN